MVDLQKLHTKVLLVIEQANSLALKYYNQSTSHNFKTKGDISSIVTQADQVINQFLLEELTALVPNSSFLGEEGREIKKESEFIWVVDPIDGTGNFAKGVDMWGISIALENNEEVIYSLISIPMLKEGLIFGMKGHGVIYKDQKLTLQPHHDFKPVYAIDSLDSEIKRKLINHDFGFNISYKSTGSTVYDLLQLIKGGYDMVFIINLAKWDFAAGLMMAQELGFTIKKIISIAPKNDDYAYSFIISKPDFYERVEKTINSVLVYV